MKHAFKILLLIFGIQFVNAQEFQSDSTYKLVVNQRETDKESSNSIASMVLAEHSEIVLSYFIIDLVNPIEKIVLKSLKNPELKDVDDIVRVDISYAQPYAYTVSHYVIMSNDIESILLPPIVNIENDMGLSETIYVFPNQIYGNVNKIIKMEITYEEAFKIEDINVIQSYVWNEVENTKF